MTAPPFRGSCLCGGVRFELAEPPLAAYYCHCTRCQRRTGAAASAQALVTASALRLVQGDDLVKGWRPPDGWEKRFCRECGAHLFSQNPGDPGRMTIRMSAFDDDPGVRPSWRCYVAYAASWEPIPDDGLLRFDEGFEFVDGRPLPA